MANRSSMVGQLCLDEDLTQVLPKLFTETAVSKRLAATAQHFERLRGPGRKCRPSESSVSVSSSASWAGSSNEVPSTTTSSSSRECEEFQYLERNSKLKRRLVHSPSQQVAPAVNEDDGLLESLGELRRQLANPHLALLDGYGGEEIREATQKSLQQQHQHTILSDEDSYSSSIHSLPATTLALTLQHESGQPQMTDPIDPLLVEERLAALDEEANMVKRQLVRLNRARQRVLPRTVQNGTMEGSDGAMNAVVVEQALLQVSGTSLVGLRANAMLAPLLDEYYDLAQKLGRGSRMRMVVERSEDSTQLHMCCWSHVWLDPTKERLCWAVNENQSSNDNKQESSKNAFSLPLTNVAAVFCGGLKEARQLSADPLTIFRVHLCSESSEPLQFVAATAQERQDWVAGLTLFHHLLQF